MLEKEADDIREHLKNIEDSDRCPSWLLQEYMNNGDEVLKMLSAAEQTQSSLHKLIQKLSAKDGKVKQYAVAITALEHVLSQQIKAVRDSVYAEIGISDLISPFNLLELSVDIDAFLDNAQLEQGPFFFTEHSLQQETITEKRIMFFDPLFQKELSKMPNYLNRMSSLCYHDFLLFPADVEVIIRIRLSSSSDQ